MIDIWLDPAIVSDDDDE